MSKIIELVDLDVSRITMNEFRDDQHGGRTYIHSMDGKGATVAFHLGKFNTFFGASYQIDKTGQPSKPRIDLELKWPKDRSSHEQAVADKIAAIRSHIITTLSEADKATRLVNKRGQPYTADQWAEIVHDPMPSKFSCSKKVPGTDEFVEYAPKLRLTLPFKTTPRPDGKGMMPDTRYVREHYDPVTKKGNRLFRDENNKAMSTDVDQLTRTIPPQSELDVYACLAYTYVSGITNGTRNGTICFQPLLVKREGVAVNTLLPDTIPGFEEVPDEVKTRVPYVSDDEVHTEEEEDDDATQGESE